MINNFVTAGVSLQRINSFLTTVRLTLPGRGNC